MKTQLVNAAAAAGTIPASYRWDVTGAPGNVIEFGPHTVAQTLTLPACNCAGQAPTCPVFRLTPHLPGCPSYDANAR